MIRLAELCESRLVLHPAEVTGFVLAVAAVIVAARGLGVAFLPSLFAQHGSDRLAVLQVSPPPLRGRLVLAWRASGPPSPAGRALVSHLREALASR